MAQVYKYTIHDIKNIILNGFEYKLNDEVIEVISNLTSEVGSPTYIKTPNFQKQNTENDDIKTQKYQSRSIYGGAGGSGSSSGGGVGNGANSKNNNDKYFNSQQPKITATTTTATRQKRHQQQQ